ncbi:integrase catalytic domain-containing protein [Nephila pilipes]|uniref:Integrase catalytic domain-containing protein n=1 Tax=Nephila pilipes TaxID=299642 RepID=A0A8X6MWH4_NEPPI|nr:integrase catalytic domain-containing protein [Nephila pilipes]
MSRLEEVPETLDYVKIAQEQSNDDELKKQISSNTNVLFEKFLVIGSKEQIFCDISIGHSRPYIPLHYRKMVFDSIHHLSHHGIHATAAAVAKKFIWPSVKKDCKKWAKTCLQCQKSLMYIDTFTHP